MPVALLYLGFLNDTHFPDSSRDADQWHAAVATYVGKVLPENCMGQAIVFDGDGSLRIVAVSLLVIEATPPKAKPSQPTALGAPLIRLAG